MVSYHHPPKVKPGSIDNRPILTTQQGGTIAIDSHLLDLWEFANGKSLEIITENFHPDQFPPAEISASLACLAEAGLLLREPEIESSSVHHERAAGPPVSVIIVGHNSLEWLPECLESIGR